MNKMWNTLGIHRTTDKIYYKAAFYLFFLFIYFFFPLLPYAYTEVLFRLSLKSAYMAILGVVQYLFPLLFCKVNTQVGNWKSFVNIFAPVKHNVNKLVYNFCFLGSFRV